MKEVPQLIALYEIPSMQYRLKLNWTRNSWNRMVHHTYVSKSMWFTIWVKPGEERRRAWIARFLTGHFERNLKDRKGLTEIGVLESRFLGALTCSSICYRYNVEISWIIRIGFLDDLRRKVMLLGSKLCVMTFFFFFYYFIIFFLS